MEWTNQMKSYITNFFCGILLKFSWKSCSPQNKRDGETMPQVQTEMLNMAKHNPCLLHKMRKCLSITGES